MVATGWWPNEIPFDMRDLTTVVVVLNKAAKQ